MMNESDLKAKMHATIYAMLRKTFSPYTTPVGYTEIADEYWDKLAMCIAESAKDIVAEVRRADVLPGIPVATTGKPNAHTGETIAPGKIK